MIPPLGKLTKVELRKIWGNEAQDFTPWLAQEDNLSILGETLKMNLELVEQEIKVGPFSADILCINKSDDSYVLIENQLEKTDHIHLGQLITYAAGLRAVNIVWIASKFKEEHRAALDWMNEITDINFNFFGLQIELWQIDNSHAAPKFNIISKPNDWSRTFSQASKRVLRKAQSIQKMYWENFIQYLKNHNSDLPLTKPYPQTSMLFSLTKIKSPGNYLVGTCNTQKNELKIGFETREDVDKKTFDSLYKNKSQIESELGFALDWKRLNDNKATRINYYKPVNLENRDEWEGYFEWMKTHLELFNKVFTKHLSDLKQ